MNLQNIKQKLDKINHFYAYLESNKNEISKIDKDSLLAYIRGLYDACLDDNAEKEVVVVEKVVEKIVEKVVEVPVEKKTEIVENEPKKGTKLIFNTTEEPKTVEKTTVIVKEEPKAVIQNPVIEKVVEKVIEPVVETQPVENTSSYNEEYEELFLFKTATDISQKLSESRLEDLSKALGLNEKFLYINELFGGDVAKFQAAIKFLNDAKTFDNARTFIEKDLIEQYKWLDKLKKPVAKDFVKLVRRRYL